MLVALFVCVFVCVVDCLFVCLFVLVVVCLCACLDVCSCICVLGWLVMDLIDCARVSLIAVVRSLVCDVLCVH